jgi:hypothetical protein
MTVHHGAGATDEAGHIAAVIMLCHFCSSLFCAIFAAYLSLLVIGGD